MNYVDLFPDFCLDIPAQSIWLFERRSVLHSIFDNTSVKQRAIHKHRGSKRAQVAPGKGAELEGRKGNENAVRCVAFFGRAQLAGGSP